MCEFKTKMQKVTMVNVASKSLLTLLIISSLLCLVNCSIKQKEVSQLSIKQLEKLALNNSIEAQIELGYRYYLGYCGFNNMKALNNWLSKEMSKSDAFEEYRPPANAIWTSTKNWEVRLDDMLKKNTNYSLALKWWLKAAENGNPLAQYMIGKMYKEGEGVTANKDSAISFFSKAAEKGFAPAQNALGMIYSEELPFLPASLSGDDTERDRHYDIKQRENYNKAFYYFKLAAQKGDADIIYRHQVFSNFNVKKDGNFKIKSKINLEPVTCEKGDAGAQYNLGYCYYKGIGTPVNNAEAYFWLYLADKKGVNDSVQRFEALNNTLFAGGSLYDFHWESILDELNKVLPEQQKKEIQTRVDNWLK